MNVKDLAQKYKEEIIAWRREFHENPELSWKEVNTANRVAKELEKLDIEVERIAEIGVLGTLKGKECGKTVALRADMDALPITEGGDIPYISKNEGVMHACGHDGHTAMLLGAAKILSEMKDQINGTVKFIFQPAEEVGTGALKMREKGVLDGVDAILGAHLWMDLPSGKVSLEPGPRMASADKFHIKIKGKAGHGSMPHQTIDSVVASAAVLMDLQTIISREVKPLEPAVVSVGKIHGGTNYNIICSEVTMEGTTRTFNPEVRKQVAEAIERIAKRTAHSYKCEAEVEVIQIVPPTINNTDISKISGNAIKKLYGEDVVQKMEKVTGGEDFSYFSEKIPGVMAFVGISNEEKGIVYPHHHEEFDIDEDALPVGTSLYAQFALDYLNTCE